MGLTKLLLLNMLEPIFGVNAVCPKLYSYPYGSRMYWRIVDERVRQCDDKSLNPMKRLGEVERDCLAGLGLPMQLSFKFYDRLSPALCLDWRVCS